MIETSNSDVDLIGATLGFVGEGSSARIAESSKRACVSFISMRFPSFPFEVGALHDGPRDRLGAGRATAVFAMAIRGDARLPVYREANLSAVTSASDHDHFEKIDMNQEPASYPANGDVESGKNRIAGGYAAITSFTRWMVDLRRRQSVPRLHRYNQKSWRYRRQLGRSFF